MKFPFIHITTISKKSKSAIKTFVHRYCCFIIIFQSLYSSATGVDTTFHYTIKLIPFENTTILDITLQFHVISDSAINAELPYDFYGTPNLYQYFRSVRTKKGIITDRDNERKMKLLPGKEKEIKINYQIAYLPTDFTTRTYAPNFSSLHFHVAACQWMLIIGDADIPHTYEIKILSPPKNWKFYSSASKNPYHFYLGGSFSDVFSKYIGGGVFSHQQFRIKKKPVDIFIHPSIDLDQAGFISSIFKVIKYQRDWFRDYGTPHYIITILPRDDNMAGLAVENMFMCFVEKNVDQKRLYQLISHEALHEWLGGKIKIKPEAEIGFAHHWFTEGFTDYFGWKILLDLNIIQQDDFADAMNRYLINFADNSYTLYSLDQLIALSQDGKFGTEAVKLQYYRGAVIALNCETALKKTSGQQSHKKFIRIVYDHAKALNRPITEKEFFFLSDKYHLDFKKKFEVYIQNAEAIIPDSMALLPVYQLAEKEVSLFNLGFSLRESISSGKIVGVVAGSPADQAGLKDGMQITDIRNAVRFGNNWKRDKPVEVFVKINNLEKKIEYFPNGKSVQVKQFIKNN